METRINPDVIFVGAGPVGLMAAIQAKLYDPDLKILMLEKYKEYKRKHLLRLDQNSFTDTHTDAAFQKFVSELPAGIRTNDLEDQLLNYAKELGIEIEYTEVKDCKELAEQYPDTKIIIGADGSHSIVHTQIFDHEYQLQKNLQYIAEIKYDVEGKARHLNLLTEIGPVTSYCKHYVTEAVGSEKDGNSPVSIRVFVDEETYKKMQNATFKNPYKLNDINPDTNQELDKDVALVYQSMHAWMEARKTIAHEKMIENSEKVTVTKLPVYASAEFVKQKHDKTWFLVGDAAFGMPYFRSLNNGILCSSQLAKSIHAKLHDEKVKQAVFLNSIPTSVKHVIIDNSIKKSMIKTSEEPEEHYVNYVQQLLQRENLVAEMKNLGVNTLQSVAASSQVIPSSRMKLAFTEDGRQYKARMDEEYPSSLSNFTFLKKSSQSKIVEKNKDDNEKKDVKEPNSKSRCNIF